MSGAIKALIAIAVTVLGVSVCSIAVKQIQEKRINNQFPSGFTEKQIKEFIAVEEQIKAKLSPEAMKDMTEDMKEAVRGDMAIVMSDILYNIEKKQILEKCDLSKLVDRIKKLAEDNGINLMDKFKAICNIYISTNDSVAYDIAKKYGFIN